MKKGFLIIIISLLLLVGISIMSYKEKESQIEEPNKTLAIYIENDNGEYEVYNGTSWPTEGYILDTTQSKCENGGLLSWDNANSKIALNSSEAEKCYVYFKKEPVVKYWNNGFVYQQFTYPNTPTTRYYTPNEIPEISTKPIYIRTDEASHAACLRYNNKDFCLRNDYWDTDGTTTKAKIQADMESAFETTATRCISYSSSVGCYFEDFYYCAASSDGYVDCFDGSSNCTVTSNGNATCS